MSRTIGTISLQGAVLQIRFPFNKKRYECIARFARARYRKHTKCWELPLIDFVQLQQTVGFRPSEISYVIEPSQLEPALEAAEHARSLANQRWLSNPFAVSEEDIELLQPEVVFRLSRSSKSIIARLRRYSRRAEWLLAQNGVEYLPSERRYRVDVQALNKLVSVLRDTEVSFAVLNSTGARLQQGAALRQATSVLSVEELKKALLYPYVDCQSPDSFTIEGVELDVAKDLLPQFATTKERRAALNAATAKEVLTLIARFVETQRMLYYSADARKALDAVVPRFREKLECVEHSQEKLLRVSLAAMPVLQKRSTWLAVLDGSLALFVPEALSDAYKTKIGRLAIECRWQTVTTPWNKGSLIVPALSSALTFYRLLQDSPQTRSYLATHEACATLDLLERSEASREQIRLLRNASDAEVPEVLPTLRTTLYPHQRIAVRWLIDTPLAFLGDDMGLGKTLSVLAASEALQRASRCDFLLVICPSSLVRNWQRECDHWFSSFRMLRMPETKAKRARFLRKLWEYKPDWVPAVVLNYEAARLPDVVEMLTKITASRRTLVCFDESQRAKNPQSKTFEALKRIADVAERRVLLSGTPTPRDIADIWAQMRLLDGGQRLGTDYYAWLSEVAELGNKWSEYAVQNFKKDGVAKTVHQVQEVLLRRRKDEVVSLPEKVFSVRDITLRTDQKRRYQEVCKDLQVRLSTTTGESYLRQIDSILEQFLRAVQIASNPRLVDETWSGEPAKFLELDEIVQELVYQRGEKLVIWSNYRKNIQELVLRYQRYGAVGFSGATSKDQRAKIIEEFQQPQNHNCAILCAIPAAGGVGITLTAAQNAVYLDKTWNAEHWMQSVDRLHRISQRGTVQILSLHAGKVDDIIYKNLLRKEREQERVLSGSLRPEQASYPTREELLAAIETTES